MSTKISTRSFAAAAWVMAKGYPVAVVWNQNGSEALYEFPSEAADDVEQFYRAKNKLNAMALLAREQ